MIPAGAAPDLHPPAGWRPGARVGAWVLEEKLGAGGMGVVFAARHQSTQVRHAIKVLTPDVDPEILVRFQREGEAQARVDDHPAILRVHGAGEAWGRPYLVLEFAPGGDLAGRLRGGPLPPEEARALVAQIAAGVQHLHEAGVLHRDLKPENVLFDNMDRPRLTDFGLARFAGAESLTETGTILGTPAYMAPEQAKGLTPDPRTDVYALGALLFACLTARAPFQGASVLGVLAQVVEDPPPVPSSLSAGVPSDLDAICARAMAKDPALRHASAAEFARDLLAPAPPPPRLPWKALALGLGTIGLLALGLTKVLGTAPLPEPRERRGASSPAEAPTKTRSPDRPPGENLVAGRLELVRKIRIAAPAGVRFVAPRLLLIQGMTRRQEVVYQLWDLAPDGDSHVPKWSERRDRAALLKGGSLFWLEASGPELRLLPSDDFPTLERPAAGYVMSLGSELWSVSRVGNWIGHCSWIESHLTTLYVWSLKSGKGELQFERENSTYFALNENYLVAPNPSGGKRSLEVRLLTEGADSSRARLLPVTGSLKMLSIAQSRDVAYVGVEGGGLLEYDLRTGERLEFKPQEQSPTTPRASRDALSAVSYADAIRRLCPDVPGALLGISMGSNPRISRLLRWPGGSREGGEVWKTLEGASVTSFDVDPKTGLLAMGIVTGSQGHVLVYQALPAER